MRRFKLVRGATLGGLLLAGAALALPEGSPAATATPAPKPPSIYTGTYPSVTTSSATLKGGVNPHGSETSYSFQYGPTTAYGSQTSPATVGAGTAEVKVSQVASGLQPGTTYHYRIVATNAAGTTDGQDVAFTTKKIPLKFARLTATPDPDVFGSPFTVSGVLSGTGSASHAVVLQANPFPYLAGFKDTGAPELTNATGAFSFPITSLMQNTQFRVATVETPAVNSPAVIERVAVRVSLNVRSTGRRGFVRLYGAVAPAVLGAHVGFQLLRRGGRPSRVGGTVVRHAGASAVRFSRVVRIRRAGLYRAFVQVENGKQVSGHSRAILIR